jgi:hypothetical protein
LKNPAHLRAAYPAGLGYGEVFNMLLSLRVPHRCDSMSALPEKKVVHEQI